LEAVAEPASLVALRAAVEVNNAELLIYIVKVFG
jgi:hypothetical protein